MLCLQAPDTEGDENPLTLWEPPSGAEASPAMVDKMLTRWLRPHQREGVQFMFDCVTGMKGYDGAGCILADDMGLGKTLQACLALFLTNDAQNPWLSAQTLLAWCRP